MSHIKLKVTFDHIPPSNKRDQVVIVDIPFGENIYPTIMNHINEKFELHNRFLIVGAECIGLFETEPSWFMVTYTSKYSGDREVSNRNITFSVDADQNIFNLANDVIESEEEKNQEPHRHMQYRIDGIYRHYIGDPIQNVVRKETEVHPEELFNAQSKKLSTPYTAEHSLHIFFSIEMITNLRNAIKDLGSKCSGVFTDSAIEKAYADKINQILNNL